METFRKIAKLLCAVLSGIAIGLLIFYSVYKEMIEFPTVEQIQHSENISMALPAEERTTLRKSRQSTVRILSLSEEGRVATSTGTYLVAKGKYYVLTVMHGLVGPCDVTQIWSEQEGFTPCKRVVVGNVLVDYAIIEVDEIPSLEAVRIPRVLPRSSEWEEALATQSKVYYTGFPNSTGPLTFSGRIVGYAEGDYIYMNSFAWGGASGSGVFGANGDFIGYVLAIDIGQSSFGVDVLEDIVIVMPAFKIDWATILE